MYLQNFDNYAELAELGENCDDLSYTSKPDGFLESSISGHYYIKDGVILVFMRNQDGKLCLRKDEMIWEVSAGNARLEQNANSGRDLMFDTTEDSVTFLFDAAPKPITSLTMEEDEDFDFPLYVCNVLNDDGRFARIYSP